MSKCEEINLAEVVTAMLHKSNIHIDVRGPGELTQTGTIGYSINIPLKDLEGALSLPAPEFKTRYGADKPSPDATNIVVFCRSGARAGPACDIFHKHGYAKVKKFPGGMNEWETTLLGSTAAQRQASQS